MDVLHGLPAPPAPTEGSAVTIGFFDGVHLGHRAVLERTVERARERSLRSVAITFDRHPREILTPDAVPRLLTTLERKIALIERTGIESLVVLPFTRDLADRSAEWFVDEVLVRALATRHAVVGSNFTFGHRALGTVEVLRRLGERLGFSVEDPGMLEIDGRAVSSSSIRTALTEGDLEWPRRALGRRYTVEGRVGRGAGRGADLGYPTANLQTEPRLLLPRQGIYAGIAQAEVGHHAAAIDVGTNPQFGVEPLHVEAFLLDFEGDLRHRELVVEFWERLRDEVTFGSVEELTAAIGADVERTRSIVKLAERAV
ncbi:MAG: bifunctional riboflavin kinase/FAD synthetase [Actinomycetota bacterium]